MRTARRPEAFPIFEQALDVLVELGDRPGEAAAAFNLAQEYLTNRQLSKAVEVSNRSLAINRAAENPHLLWKVLNQLGDIYVELARWPDAGQHYREALQYTRDVGLRGAEGEVLENFGILYYKQNPHAEALEYYTQALPPLIEAGDIVRQGVTRTHLGTLYYELQQPALAMDSYQQALALVRQTGDRFAEALVLRHLGAGYFLQGQHGESLRLFQQSLAIT